MSRYNNNNNNNNQDKEEKVVKSEYGIVRYVNSGDSFTVQAVNAPFLSVASRELTLASCNAPRLGRGGSKDEPWAWASREYLRSRLQGQKVRFQVEYKNPKTNREYCQVYVGAPNFEENIGVSCAAEGWVKVRQPTGNFKPKEIQQEQIDKSTIAQEKEIGMFQKVSKVNKIKAIRPIKQSFDSYQLFSKYGNKPQQFVVEYVRDGSTLKGYLLPSFHFMTIRIAGVQCPITPYNFQSKQEGKPEPFFTQAKAYTCQCVLGYTVQLNIICTDKSPGVFFASIGRVNKDLGTELIRSGLAKYVEWSCPNQLRKTYVTLESEAKQKNAFIWKYQQNHQSSSSSSSTTNPSLVNNTSSVASSSSSSSSSITTVDPNKFTTPKSFHGKVKAIRPNSEILVEITSIGNKQSPVVGKEVSLSLSSIMIPRMAKLREHDEPYGFEAFEFLRKLLIDGNVSDVRVFLDFHREAFTTNDGREVAARDYFSVYQDNKNVAVLLVQEGLAKVINHSDGQDRSSDYKNLLIAENQAKRSKKGVNGDPKRAPVHRLTDLTLREANRNKLQVQTKRFLPSLQRAKRTSAVIEYCYASSKFKVRVPAQTCIINFAIAGVQCNRTPNKNQQESSSKLSEAEIIAIECLNFVRSSLNQRTIEIEVHSVDKSGTFFGNLWLRKFNFASTLLEKGFASVHQSASRTRYASDYNRIETEAKKLKIGIWKNDASKSNNNKDNNNASSSNSGSSSTTHHLASHPILKRLGIRNVADSTKQEWNLRVRVSEIVDAGWFYVQIYGNELDQLKPLMEKLQQVGNALKFDQISPLFWTTLKKKQVCLGQFSADKQWYRVEIQNVDLNNSKAQVLYIDYGNAEEIDFKLLKPLNEPSLSESALPRQAFECYLALLNPPRLDEDYGVEAVNTFRKLVWGKDLYANIEYIDQNRLFLSLGDPTLRLLVNAAMVREGFSLVEQKKDAHLKSFIARLLQEEDLACKERKGIFRYGDIRDDDY